MSRGLKGVFLVAALMMLPFTCDGQDLGLDFRVRIVSNEITLLFTARNVSDEPRGIWGFLYSGNCLIISALHIANRESWSRCSPSSPVDPYSRIQPQGYRVWERDFNEDRLRSALELLRGSYVKIVWRTTHKGRSRPVYFGLTDDDGMIRSPVVSQDSHDVQTHIGVVHQQGQVPELLFLLLNGTGSAVTVEAPLTRASSIVARAPAIEYERELYVPDRVVERAAIGARQVGEWRLPWSVVRALIPPEDMDRIIEAGGKLDLVWTVGDYESDVLPLTFADPVEQEVDERPYESWYGSRIPPLALTSLPALTTPVSPSLALTADRSQDSTTRLRPLVDGTVTVLSEPQDILLMRRILCDPSEEEAVRIEAAKLLLRSASESGMADLTGDLTGILDQHGEQARFRAFAAQYLGLIWEAEGYAADTPAHQILVFSLVDQHVPVRRKAVQALVRGGDDRARLAVQFWLTVAEASPFHALGCSLAADHGWRSLLPQIRKLLLADDPVIQVAAVDALRRLGDRSSVDLLRQIAAGDQPRLAAAAQQAVTELTSEVDDAAGADDDGQ